MLGCVPVGDAVPLADRRLGPVTGGNSRRTSGCGPTPRRHLRVALRIQQRIIAAEQVFRDEGARAGRAQFIELLERLTEVVEIRSQFLAQESEKIPTVIPEWKDKAVAERESKEIVDWMLKSGYTQQAVKSLNTSTALDLATFRKAALFDKLQASKPQIENKLRTAPKLVKPGQTQPTTAEQTLRSLKQTVIKSSGKGGSVAAYLMATGKA